MAKLLLSCDEYVYRYNGAYYAASQEWADFFLRYLRVFDNLRLVCRCIDESDWNDKRVILDERIEYVPLPMYRGPKEYAKVYCKIGKVLKNVAKGCDAAVLRLPSQESIRAYPFVKKEGIPYATEVVYDAHDGYRSSESLVHKLLWMRIDKKMRMICNNADGVACVTEHYLQRRYHTKKTDGFTANYSSLALPKSFYGAPRFFPTKDIFTIVHVANQVEYKGRKGHNEIIESVAILKDWGITVCVKFIGKDYLGGQCRLEYFARNLNVGDQIQFTGYMNRSALASALDSADIFVLPTRAEGLPRVIIEAMAKGLPCISTNVSGNPELLNPHWLIGYEDTALLAERIKELCTNRLIYEATSLENYNNSLKYEASILEKRRDAFYGNLKDVASTK